MKELLSELCFILGLNTAHDYDGINTEEDINIYSKAVKREIKNLSKKNGNPVPPINRCGQETDKEKPKSYDEVFEDIFQQVKDEILKRDRNKDISDDMLDLIAINVINFNLKLKKINNPFCD